MKKYLLIGLAAGAVAWAGILPTLATAGDQDRTRTRQCAEQTNPECPGTQIQQRDRDRDCEPAQDEFEAFLVWLFGG